MASGGWWYPVYLGVICLVGGVIALTRRMEWRRRGLDSKEMGVLLRAQVTSLSGSMLRVFLVCCFLGLGAFLPPLWCFAFYRQRVAVKEVVGFDPGEQNRADGVVFWFYELRLTRTELIRGYQADAPRIPLGGLTAEATTQDGTVEVTIKGAPRPLVYSIPSMPFESFTGFKLNLRGARQFAALLNYEAIRQNYEATLPGGTNHVGPDPLTNQSSGQAISETRPVTHTKANDGYHKKCLACGKFTRGAKVCRYCGRRL
jgi:hypothetical protein